MSINTGGGTKTDVTLEELQKMTATAASQKMLIWLDELSERVGEALRVLDSFYMEGFVAQEDYRVLREAISDIYPDNGGDDEMSNYVYEECPYCGHEIGLEWNVEEMGYQVHCPACGRAVMLCGECHQGESVTRCDWSNETNRCFRSTVDAHCGEKPPVRKPRTGPENGENEENICYLTHNEVTVLWRFIEHYRDDYIESYLVGANEEGALKQLNDFLGAYLKLEQTIKAGGQT